MKLAIRQFAAGSTNSLWAAHQVDSQSVIWAGKNACPTLGARCRRHLLTSGTYRRSAGDQSGIWFGGDPSGIPSSGDLSEIGSGDDPSGNRSGSDLSDLQSGGDLSGRAERVGGQPAAE